MLVSIVLFAHIAMVWAKGIDQEAELVASEIVESISLSEAIFLDIRCGEWTPALSQHLKQKLLAQGADIRQTRNSSIFADLDQESQGPSLSEYGLDLARLVQVSMNLSWQTREHKSFFSYRTERMIVHNFEVKQVLLPEYRLISIDSFDHVVPDSPDGSLSAPRLRWFEPLIATTAIASIVFLLWTIE